MIREYLIERESIGMFAPLIPERYVASIQSEELVGVGLYDPLEDELAGVAVFREMNGWMEFVWVKFSEAYQESEDAMGLIKNCLDRAKRAGMLVGAYIDFTDEMEAKETEWMFDALGFRKDVVSNDVYELTVADVRDTVILHQPSSKHVRALGTLNEEKRKKIAKAIIADKRPIPLEQPVNWSQYDERVSVAYMDGTDPKGLLLFEWQEDMLVFSCAWAAEPKVLVLMLISALQETEQTKKEDTQIIIPVLDKQTAGLVKKLVPKATCRDKIERSLGFGI